MTPVKCKGCGASNVEAGRIRHKQRCDRIEETMRAAYGGSERHDQCARCGVATGAMNGSHIIPAKGGGKARVCDLCKQRD